VGPGIPVMNRGDRREIIFHDNFDRELILRPLGEPWHKVNFQIAQPW